MGGHSLPRLVAWIPGTLALLAALALAAPAAGDPALRVSKRKLDRALHCQRQVRNARTEPVLLVNGTGSTGSGAWASGPNFRAALLHAGHSACYVNFPAFTSGDIQTSAEYVVNGIRVMRRRAGRRIGVYTHSQGGLIAQWALSFWPQLRRRVADVVSVAGPHHGMTGTPTSDFVAANCPTLGCAPALWQMAVNSHFLKALNARRDETPGRRTAWTTVRTLSDGIVEPQQGPYPTSSLFGAHNLLIQRVCPDRTTTHFAAPFDSLSFAALIDALQHRGGARRSRFAKDVCTHPYAPGLDLAVTKMRIDTAFARLINRLTTDVPTVRAEPRVRHYARIRR